MSYQNVSNDNGKTKFVSVDANGAVTELYTRSKNASIGAAGGGRVKTITQAVSLQRVKDVSCDENSCARTFIGNGVKIEFTAVSGDTATISALIVEAKRILDVWRTTMNADHGMSPPVSSTFGA